MFDRLRLLWVSRESLSEGDWQELFQLVHSVLLRARLLDGHGLSRQELIHDFFVDKLITGRSDAAPFNNATLLHYFKLYQYDRLPAKRPPQEAMPPAESCSSESLPNDTLFLSIREPKIHQFFDYLSQEEKLLIAFVQCKDHSVLEVEQQHAIRSGAYRAKQLGIVLSKSAIPNSWGETKLGRVVVDGMGIPIEDDSAPDMMQVFRLLCAKASDWWGQQ